MYKKIAKSKTETNLYIDNYSLELCKAIRLILSHIKPTMTHDFSVL